MNRMSVPKSLVVALICAAAPMPVLAASAAATAARYDVATLEPGERYDRFIVRYAAHAPQHRNAASTTASVDQRLRSSGARLARGTVRYVRHLSIGSELVELPGGLDADGAAWFMESLAADPNVLHVEPDVIDQVFADEFVPNDPLYADYQWHLHDPDSGIQAPAAWTLANGGRLPVAVIDTGITEHPDLDTSLASAGYDFVSVARMSGRARNGRIAGGWDPGDWTTARQCSPFTPGRNSSWHGTHVAGTIAQRTNNAVGAAGVAFGARVVPIRALGHCGGLRSDIAEAIVWASGGTVAGVPANANPAAVINLSIGGNGACSPGSAYHQAIAAANRNRAIVVVASGNENRNASLSSPGNCAGVINVAATGVTTRRAYYSNFGPTVDIAAPGGGVYRNDAGSGEVVDEGFVWQSYNDGAQGPGNPTYGGSAGTSMAAPHVAGVVAMVLHAQMARGLPPYDGEQMRLLLQRTARPFVLAPDPAKPIGPGIVDAHAAILRATDVADPLVATLVNRSPLTGQTTSRNGAARYYAFDVPAGTARVSLRTYGGSGNLTLYVGAPGTIPSETDYAQRSANAGNSELVTLQTPEAGRYYLMLTTPATFANVSVLGTY